MSLSFFIPQNKRSETYPRLKGRGAEVNGIVGPLIQVWATFSRGAPHDNRVARALESLSEVQATLDDYKSDLLWPARVSSEFVDLTERFLADYSYLGAQADIRSETLFSAVPKLHFLWHLAYRSKFMNPRRVATFMGEDFVKVCKGIAARCTAGT